MTAPTDVDLPAPETVVEIVGDVFGGLFGEDYGRPYEGDAAGPLPVTGTVAVSGGWNGEVVFACSEQSARRAAAQLFELPADAVADDDLRDVVGEFANVIGGNIKSVMPGPSVLSLPATALAAEARPADRPASFTIDLTWMGEVFRIDISTILTS